MSEELEFSTLLEEMERLDRDYRITLSTIESWEKEDREKKTARIALHDNSRPLRRAKLVSLDFNLNGNVYGDTRVHDLSTLIAYASEQVRALMSGDLITLSGAFYMVTELGLLRKMERVTRGDRTMFISPLPCGPGRPLPLDHWDDVEMWRDIIFVVNMNDIVLSTNETTTMQGDRIKTFTDRGVSYGLVDTNRPLYTKIEYLYSDELHIFKFHE